MNKMINEARRKKEIDWKAYAAEFLKRLEDRRTSTFNKRFGNDIVEAPKDRQGFSILIHEIQESFYNEYAQPNILNEIKIDEGKVYGVHRKFIVDMFDGKQTMYTIIKAIWDATIGSRDSINESYNKTNKMINESKNIKVVIEVDPTEAPSDYKLLFSKGKKLGLKLNVVDSIMGMDQVEIVGDENDIRMLLSSDPYEMDGDDLDDLIDNAINESGNKSDKEVIEHIIEYLDSHRYGWESNNQVTKAKRSLKKAIASVGWTDTKKLADELVYTDGWSEEADDIKEWLDDAMGELNESKKATLTIYKTSKPIKLSRKKFREMLEKKDPDNQIVKWMVEESKVNNAFPDTIEGAYRFLQIVYNLNEPEEIYFSNNGTANYSELPVDAIKVFWHNIPAYSAKDYVSIEYGLYSYEDYDKVIEPLAKKYDVIVGYTSRHGNCILNLSGDAKQILKFSANEPKLHELNDGISIGHHVVEERVKKSRQEILAESAKEASITVDVYDIDDATFEKYAKKFNVKVKSGFAKTPSGPQPELTITGYRANIKKYLMSDLFEYDDEEVEDLFDEYLNESADDVILPPRLHLYLYDPDNYVKSKSAAIKRKIAEHIKRGNFTSAQVNKIQPEQFKSFASLVDNTTPAKYKDTADRFNSIFGDTLNESNINGIYTRLKELMLNESEVAIKHFAINESAIVLPNGNITYTVDGGKTWNVKRK